MYRFLRYVGVVFLTIAVMMIFMSMAGCSKQKPVVDVPAKEPTTVQAKPITGSFTTVYGEEICVAGQLYVTLRIGGQEGLAAVASKNMARC